jgi:hypothetical protein
MAQKTDVETPLYVSDVLLGYGLAGTLAASLTEDIFGSPLQDETNGAAFSWGVAPECDGSGRWPDDMPVIECQSCEHLTINPEIP